MANAVGPTFTGGFEEFVVNDERGEAYTIAYLPDRSNDELAREGKSQVFYYLPEQVRLARKGDLGDYKFHHLHFVGVFDENTIGVENGETQGGVLALTTTSRFPTEVLKQSQDQLLAKFSGKDDKYWGIRTRAAPMFRMAPITQNVTAISNLAPGPDGSTPQEAAGGAGAAGGGTPGAEPAPGEAPGADAGPRSRGIAMRGAVPWKPVPHGRGFRAPTALNPWAWRMEGQGPGSVTGGENAYAGLIGPIPSEIIWAGFHGAYSPIVITQHLVLPMWSQLMRVKITGKWSRVFDHFSGAANASYLWFAADIKAEFNRMRMNGDIKVEVDIDGTMPGGQEMERAINQRIDMIVAQFTAIAKTVIFDPPQPNVQPAQAPSGGLFSSIFGGSGGLALKARHDETHVDLSYEETRYFRYNQPHTISSSMEGFFNAIKQDPDAERKYFTRLVLGGLGRKVRRLVKSVVNWPDRSKQWVGEPVAFLSAQVGYPGEQGQIQWSPNTFQASDPPDSTWKPVFVERRMDEVDNPPQGWEPDKTFLKRKVHLLEPPGESEYPFMKVFVEQNVISLDPEPNGTLTNDNIVEVRADAAGMLDVGPLAIGVALETSAQVVEVEFRAKGKRTDGTERMDKSTRFRWTFTDQDEPRYWRIFTGQPDFVPAYQYRVHVTVKGSLFSNGQAWSGPWVDGSGNGALMVGVPGPDDEGVVKRSLTSREMFFVEAVRAAEPYEEVPAAPFGAPAPVVAGALSAPRSDTGVGAPQAPRGWMGEMAAVSARGTAGSGAVMPPRTIESAKRAVQGYGLKPGEAGSKKAQTSTSRAARPTRRDTAGEDAGDWVEVPGSVGSPTAVESAAQTTSPRKARGRDRGPALAAEEDAGDWTEVPPN